MQTVTLQEQLREEGFFECTWVNENEWAGIRPVITVEKEKLKY